MLPSIIRIAAVTALLACAALAHADVNELLSPGQLIEGHAKYESECFNCHKKFDKAAQAGLCKSCHKEIAKDIAEKHGFHGLMKEEKQCRECHTEHKGRKANISQLDTKNFDHSITGFVLKGGHLAPKVQCKNCHDPKKKYRDAPTKCNACHEKDDKHKGSFGPECQNCHEEKDWKTIHFDHNKSKFPLLGKHKDVKCKACHIDDKFKETPTACVACHKKDDKHKTKFGPKCETCHVERSWKEIIFDHDKKTDYPLLGKHREVKCVSCHTGFLYKDKLQKTCISCHKKDDKHKGNFGPKCESCHVERSWKEIAFDHDHKTHFPLTGKHHGVKCNACHKGDLVKDKLKMDCVSCHKKDDKHKGNFGPKCETCHVDRGWKEITFDHDRKTKFPLLGKHHETKCTSCHKGELYKEKLKTDCFSCHEKDDKHKGQEGKKCDNCHRSDSWKKAIFDHRFSRFPLTGKHMLVECKKCHATVLFKDAKSDCWSCHQKQDIHKRSLGMLCDTCHNTRSWKDWDFDHDKTRFKLEGKHKTLKCIECHNIPATNHKLVVAATCVSCHDKDDKHSGAYGRQCDQCHVGSSWKVIKEGSDRWIKSSGKTAAPRR